MHARKFQTANFKIQCMMHQISNSPFPISISKNLTFASLIEHIYMNKIKINDRSELNVAVEAGEAHINESVIDWDLKELPDGTFSILADGKSYNAIVENVDREAKQLKVKINGNTYDLAIKEPIDQLLQKMGLNISTVKKADAIKAPMPGLVLKILVTEGQAIKKGEPVLILEAMKMENVFKAPADAVVKAIKVEERKAVEKGEVLIELG